MADRNPFRLFAYYSAIIFLLPSCLLVSYLIGSWLDTRLGTSPWLTAVFFLLGMAAGFLQVFRMLERKP